MPESQTVSCSPTGDDQTKKDNATSQALVLFGAPKDAVEIFHENKMTNTEGLNKGIYFSYPCRRHSCALVNIPAPCVNKMISHIEDVESKIQEHLKQFETSFEEWSRTSTKDLKEDWSIATPPKEIKPEEERDEKCPELKQELEALLSEAIHLIKSLETDRAEAEEALKQQKSRRKQINVKIDTWSLWRLQEIPLAVQKEHEAYLRDIIELRWHLQGKVHQLKYFEEQKAKLDEANAKVQVDIDYMNEHCPLLNSKLIQELEAQKEYYIKKNEVMELCKQVHKELQEATEECENLKLKVKQIREEMEKDINDDIQTIEAYKKEIEKLNHLYNYYDTLIQNVNVTIEEREEEVTDVLKETKKSTDELTALSKTLDELKRVYDQLVRKKKKFQNNYLDTFNNFYDTKKSWDMALSNIARNYSDISIAYTELMDENKRIVIDIEFIVRSINDSIKKKEELESEIQTLMQLKSKYADRLKQVYKDSYNVGAVFLLTRHKTEELEQQIAGDKRKFKGREEFLKKHTRAEVANGMIIQKRLYSLQEDQELVKEEFLNKKAMYSLILAEIEAPMLQMEEDAVRMKTLHQEHSDALTHILEEKKHVIRNVERKKKKLERKGKEAQEALIKTEEKSSMIFKEIQTTKSKTMLYEEKVSQLTEDLDKKEKEKKILDRTLDNLRNQFLTMKFKKEHAQAVYNHLISERKNCKERIYEEDQRHRLLITTRQNTLEDIKKIQDESLEENLRLAQEYQKLLMNFLVEKDNYFNLYDRQLSLDASVRDKKQLCQLQRRIHKVWQKYFKLVVLYSQMRLAKFQADSQESIQKILAVQNQYDLEKE
uniref:Coiled-coil domain containing 178 n=1 Tax=Rhinolophus ferrumequinum TaxID=59479 RepID=A0A671G6K9_RHIFE